MAEPLQPTPPPPEPGAATLTGEATTPAAPGPPPPPPLDPATRRALAVGIYNHCWELLGIAGADAEQDAQLIHAAHASRFHWGEIADTPARLWRGEWMCSRVYAVLGRGRARAL